MKITNGKDFWAGLMFIAFGLAFMIVAQNYAMGNAVRMGPAYFPTVLGGILAVLGAVVLLRAFVSKIEHPLRVFPFRLWYIPIGVGLGVLACNTQPSRDAGIALQIGHMLVAGLAVGLTFAAFGERSLWVVLFAVVLFGYALKPLGLVLAVFILTIVSAVPGFAWTRKDFQMLPAYAAVGVLLTYLTLVVSSWIQHPVLAVFGAVGLKLPPVLVLLLVEIGLGGVLAFFAGRYKWPQITAGARPLAMFPLFGFFGAAVVPHRRWARDSSPSPWGVAGPRPVF